MVKGKTCPICGRNTVFFHGSSELDDWGHWKGSGHYLCSKCGFIDRGYMDIDEKGIKERSFKYAKWYDENFFYKNKVKWEQL